MSSLSVTSADEKTRSTRDVKKEIPKFKSEAEEFEFWSSSGEAADSTKFLDWSQAKRAKLSNLKPSLRTGAPAGGNHRGRERLGKATAVIHGALRHPKSMKIEQAIWVGEGRGSVEPV